MRQLTSECTCYLGIKVPPDFAVAAPKNIQQTRAPACARVILSREHVFPLTRLHQELNGGIFRDVICDAAHDPSAEDPFKGNFDLGKLTKLIAEVGASAIPFFQARFAPVG